MTASFSGVVLLWLLGPPAELQDPDPGTWLLLCHKEVTKLAFFTWLLVGNGHTEMATGTLDVGRWTLDIALVEC